MMVPDVMAGLSILLAAALAAYAWQLARADRRRSDARVAALAAAIEGTAADGTDAAPAMFDSGPPSAVRGRPVLKIAAGFAMAVFLIVVIAMSGDRRQAPAAAVSPEHGALELVSMRHERAGDALTVTGLVRNPGAAAPGAIMAVIFAFDREGAFVASGLAPLEFAAISAGDESPFRVTVPDVQDVGRYRVSFRTAAGVVRHVDRRSTLHVSAH